uniref:Tripartite motif-containing protein 16-like n=1 Tax=Haplochromis burtoni TaxID=8153 RepID=A0A3Q2V1D2_HAPBU
MAQRLNQLDSEKFSCSICLELLQIPVTIPCGHSYCLNWIKIHFDDEDRKQIHTCPQCRKTFTPRPILEKNILLAILADHCYNICFRHNEVMKIFCRTDQQTVCYLCLLDEHKGHETVPAATERTEKQKELEVRRLKIQQSIQNREKDVKLLQQQVEAIISSADKTVVDSEKMFTELISLIQNRSSDVKQQIRSKQETEVNRVKEVLEKLEKEIAELKRKDAELEQLSHTEDHNQFLHTYPSLSTLTDSTPSSSISICPQRYFEDVTAALSEATDKLQEFLREKWTNSSLKVTEKDALLSPPEPKTRAGFLKYSSEITLDPNTAFPHVLLSEGNRKATRVKQKQAYFHHPDRFSGWEQVLSRESLTGRCYWEVEWRGGGVGVAVAYKTIRRIGKSYECLFGFNDKSWALCCDTNSYVFWHNNVQTKLSGPRSFRVGVYLDHSAGIMSFYSISETMTLLHRVQTTFTQPLSVGLWLWVDGSPRASFFTLQPSRTFPASTHSDTHGAKNTKQILK